MNSTELEEALLSNKTKIINAMDNLPGFLKVYCKFMSVKNPRLAEDMLLQGAAWFSRDGCIPETSLFYTTYLAAMAKYKSRDNE